VRFSNSRGGILVTLVLSLTACGGGGSSPPPDPPAVTVRVGGTVSGLTGPVVLRDNGADDLTLSADGAFAFSTSLGSGVAYAVSVGTQPPNQTCAVTNGTGMTATADITNVSVTCTTTPADPAISGISPDHGPGLTRVIITGSGFGATPADNAVTLNNKECTIVSATTTTLTVDIPPQAGSGNLQVLAPPSQNVAISSLFTYELTSVTVSTIAGKDLGSRDDVGTNAQFRDPVGIVMSQDKSGLFIADSGNFRIRFVNLSSHSVSTIAGNTPGNVDDVGLLALFGGPDGLSIDERSGELLVTDPVNNNIRRISSVGVVTTEIRDAAGLIGPRGLASFGDQFVVVDKGNNRLITFSSSAAGAIQELAGGSIGDKDGNGSSAQFQFPEDVAACINASDKAYVADEENFKIRKITSTGEVTTYAGGSSGVSFQDGPAAEARFLFPTGLACDEFENLYVADNGNNKIRLITPSGIVTTLAGSSLGFADGDGATAKFSQPHRIALGVRVFGKYPNGKDMRGTVLYVTDTSNQRIREIDWE